MTSTGHHNRKYRGAIIAGAVAIAAGVLIARWRMSMDATSDASRDLSKAARSSASAGLSADSMLAQTETGNPQAGMHRAFAAEDDPILIILAEFPFEIPVLDLDNGYPVYGDNFTTFAQGAAPISSQSKQSATNQEQAGAVEGITQDTGKGGDHSAAPSDVKHDGNALIAGGQNGVHLEGSATEIFDADQSAFSEGPLLNSARAYHSATMLPDGGVLIAGGLSANGDAQASAEIYDPSTRRFVPTGAMATARYKHSVTLISGCRCAADGKVLIAGGFTEPGQKSPTASAELFDPAAGTFAPAAPMTEARAGHTATSISAGAGAGSVLIAGGIGSGGAPLASAETFDGSAGVFAGAPSMSSARNGHSATFLDPSIVKGPMSGKVLVAGGTNGTNEISAAEIFDPATAAFSDAGAMTTARSGHTATLLATGEVLIAGGEGNSKLLVSAEVFSPASGAFAATTNMSAAHVGADAAMLGSGRVLIAGGRSVYAETYSPTTRKFSLAGTIATGWIGSTVSLIP
jgi:hypothetical protein